MTKRINRISSFLCSISLMIMASWNLLSEDAVQGEKLDAAEFLKIARRPPLEESWAKMQGEISHKRGNSDTVKYPIYLGIRFTPERTLAQLVANDNEFYNIGQSYSDKPENTSIIVNRPEKDKSVLADCGIRPEDLTLSFLYWSFQKELKSEDVIGCPCRIFQLLSPDKKESATVYISSQYFLPLKVEWFKVSNRKEPVEPDRTLEIKSFKKEPTEKFYLVYTLGIYGPGFRTKIDFPESSAGYSKDGVPPELFQKLPEAK